MDIDFEKLKRDLLDFFCSAMFSGFKMAIVDYSEVENATDQELIEIALNNGFDLNKYTKKDLNKTKLL